MKNSFTKQNLTEEQTPSDFIRTSFAGKKVSLELVTRGKIKNACIAINSSFYNSNKTRNNSISAFDLPKESLSYSCNLLNYGDLIKGEDSVDEAYKYIVDIVSKYSGCLITDHNNRWHKMARELLLAGKYVYINTHQLGRDIYFCRLEE